MTTTRSTERGFRGLPEPELSKLNQELRGATWETRWLEADENQDVLRRERTRESNPGHA